MNDYVRFVSDRKHFETIFPLPHPNDRKIQSYGFLAGLEVKLDEPMPNMDVDASYYVRIEIIAPDGSRPRFSVIGEFRDVKTAEEALRA